MENQERINLDQPRWNQHTFIGRFKHFWEMTDPRAALCSRSQLIQAKVLLDQYKNGTEPSGTTEEQLWRAKKLFSSAFHPDTGDLQNVIGRMSFQVPGGMAITGFMLQFYRTTPAVIFWQWVNQSFNALVNYTNRNAQSQLSMRQLAIAYVSATTSAVVTAVGLKNLLQKRATNLVQRFVPFAAVAAANCVNIPLMRQSELLDGIAVFDENGNKVGVSQAAAVKGISQVVLSRIVMAAPGMLLCPLIMEKMEKYKWMQKIKPMHGPIQVLIVGCFLVVMVPNACALFPQNCSIQIKTIKKWESQKFDAKNMQDNAKVFFNKGL